MLRVFAPAIKWQECRLQERRKLSELRVVNGKPDASRDYATTRVLLSSTITAGSAAIDILTKRFSAQIALRYNVLAPHIITKLNKLFPSCHTRRRHAATSID
mmetsp:Transcript_69577/g.115610  ORF Transcript_69577/g.115610 Transcript_69577/m.115610 type:complete len:102 (-) Transcript_69577:87-392(-)